MSCIILLNNINFEVHSFLEVLLGSARVVLMALIDRFIWNWWRKMTPFLYRFALINEWGLPAILVPLVDEFISFMLRHVNTISKVVVSRFHLWSLTSSKLLVLCEFGSHWYSELFSWNWLILTRNVLSTISSCRFQLWWRPPPLLWSGLRQAEA